MSDEEDKLAVAETQHSDPPAKQEHGSQEVLSVDWTKEEEVRAKRK